MPENNQPSQEQLQAAADDFNANSEVKIKPFLYIGSLLIEEDKKDWEHQSEFMAFVEDAKIKVRAFLKDKYGVEV
jgi:hypothetical protein